MKTRFAALVGLLAAACWLSPVRAQLPPPSTTSADIVQWLSDTSRCGHKLDDAPTQPLTLTTALRAVICHNTQLQQSAAGVLQARAGLDRAQSAWQPSLTVRSGVNGARGDGSQAGASLDLEWVLLDFGARSAAVVESRQALQATLDEQSSEVLRAIAQAAQLYASTQAAFWRFEAANTNVRSALQSQRMAKARMGAGAASQLEKLQADTALAQTRVEFARAMNTWMSARGELSLAMGWPASRPLLLAQTDGPADTGDDTPIDLEALMAEARANHPRVAAARARQAEAQARVAGFQSQNWGSVSVAARANRSRQVTGVGDGGTGRTGASASVEWSLPLLDRGVLRSQVRDSQGRVQLRTAELEESQRQTALQVWQEAQTLLGERSALRASRILLDSAEASFRVSGERFRLGVGSFTDLVQAQSAAAGARLQWAESRANLTRAHWRLAAAAGRFGALQMSMDFGQALPR